jgi:glycosyltransferase involved in cell wall biosynthesis
VLHAEPADLTMKVAILSETFSKKMGYLPNLLPKYLARLGVDVHLIAMDLSPYYYAASFEKTYGDFVGAGGLTPGTVEFCDGFTLHVLSHRKQFGYMRMVGLRKRLRVLKPDIVQASAAIGWIPLDAALSIPFARYRLFTGSHMASSVFPLARRNSPWWAPERLECALKRAVPGRLVSLVTEKCYTPTEDCALIACRYFGVQPSKVEVMYLGIDTDYLYPAISPPSLGERSRMRAQLGFQSDEIICIYTGKFTEDKKTLLLAHAVEQLRNEGLKCRALFIGNGPDRELLRARPWVSALEFLPFCQLGSYYRAADLGVWPGNESTSMLDAAACGLPIIMSDEVFYRAPVEGEDQVFRKDSIEDLKRAILALRDSEKRQALGLKCAARMARDFSWESIARRRLLDYEAALGLMRPSKAEGACVVGQGSGLSDSLEKFPLRDELPGRRELGD